VKRVMTFFTKPHDGIKLTGFAPPLND